MVAPYARDSDAPHPPWIFAKIWGVSSHVSHVIFPTPTLLRPKNLVEHYL